MHFLALEWSLALGKVSEMPEANIVGFDNDDTVTSFAKNGRNISK